MLSDALQREATHVQTAPERLRHIFASSPGAPVLRALSKNPNTPSDVLWKLAAKFPREVLENPVLPLLHLENSDVGNAIPEAAALGFLCLDDLPGWMLSSFAHGPLGRNAEIKAAIGQHWQFSGEAEPGWEDAVRDAVSKLAKAEVTRLINDWYGDSVRLEHVLRLRLVPDWLAEPLSEELERAREINRRATPHTPPANDPGALDRSALSFIDRSQAARQVSQGLNEITVNSGGVTIRALDCLRKWRRSQWSRNANFDPDLAQTQLEQLAEKNSRARSHLISLLRKQARDQTADFNMLRRLATSPARVVRRVVARHPDAPQDVLELLASDPDAWVRGALARNERLPAQLLTRLAGDDNSVVRANAARHPQASHETLRRLAGDEDGEVLDALWHRSDLPEELTKVVERQRAQVTMWGSSRPPKQKAGDPQTPPEALERLAFETLAQANEADETLLRRVASHRNTPSSTLSVLATYAKGSVRAAVAGNAATPVEVLRRLSGDTFDVRKQLATNRWAPLEVLLNLLDEDKPFQNSLHHSFHRELAKNAALPVFALETLLSQVQAQIQKDAHTRIWNIAPEPTQPTYRSYFQDVWFPQQKESLFQALLTHPNASRELRLGVRELRREDVLLSLAQSDHPFQRAIALSCAQTPVEVLEANLYARNWLWRLAIARNPAVPHALLETLAHDGNHFVRSWAARRRQNQATA
jgi:hypothetical protein